MSSLHISHEGFQTPGPERYLGFGRTRQRQGDKGCTGPESADGGTVGTSVDTRPRIPA